MKKPKIKPPPNWEDTPQSFEKFERLAKALVTIPKKQLDKEQTKHSRRKVQKEPKS